LNTLFDEMLSFFMLPEMIYMVTNRFQTVKEILVQIRVMKTNLMHYLSSVYFVSQPLRVLGMFVARRYTVYTTIGTCCAF